MDATPDSGHQFYPVDYVVFGLTFFVAIAIGTFHALRDRWRDKSTTDEYLLGGRSMGALPTAISLVATFDSAIMMLGLPAETYLFGVQVIWMFLGMSLCQLLAVNAVVSLIHPLRITSAYEYLELRYKSRAVRLLGTFLGILSMTWYMGIVLFGPSVALEAVAGYPVWNSIAAMALVSVIYTSIGGIKAVIWTDVFQAVVMLTGVFGILIQGTIGAGGPKKVWNVASAGGRFNFFNFDPDPRVRHTFWNLFPAAIIRGLGLFFNQNTVQRISSTKSLGDAKRMLIYSAPGFLFTSFIVAYEGIVVYSYFYRKACDPVASKQISNPNQLVPFTVMDMFGEIPGMTGLFLASLFSASLSTLSSGLASLATLTWADVLQPWLGDISEVKATLIIKFTVVFYGGAACAVSFLVAQVGGTLTQIAGTLIMTFSGPLTGIFFLACFFPRSNAKGVMIGGILSMLLCVWISMGKNFSPSVRPAVRLSPAGPDKCYLSAANMSGITSVNPSNFSTYETSTSILFAMANTSTTAETLTGEVSSNSQREPHGVEHLYTLSYQYISIVGILCTCLVGMLASFCTGMNRPGDVDPRYLISISDSFLVFLPKSARRYIGSFGPQFMKDIYKENSDSDKPGVELEDEETETPFLSTHPKHGDMVLRIKHSPVTS